MESWPSGPRQQFAKLRSRKRAHRFKSYTLRHQEAFLNLGRPFFVFRKIFTRCKQRIIWGNRNGNDLGIF